jgi:hypothetical protein
MINDVTQYLAVETTSFESKIKVSEKQKLRKANRVFQFSKLPIDRLPNVYDLIKSNRIWKNYPITTTYEWLNKLVQYFPEDYLLFGVFDDEMIAAAVAIRINREILYTFYLGDVPRTRNVSPVVFLLDGIYNYSEQMGFKLLDLGISTDQGVLNFGLYNFKKNLGAMDSIRTVWSKMLD